MVSASIKYVLIGYKLIRCQVPPSVFHYGHQYRNGAESDLTTISGLKSSLYILSDWCAILILIGLPVLAHHQGWVYVIGILLMCRYQKALAILGHDGVHGRLFRSSSVNEYVSQYLLGGPILMSFFGYRERHLRHHRFTQSTLDPDLEPDIPGRRAGFILLRWFAKDLSGITFLQSLLLLAKDHRMAIRAPNPIRERWLHFLFSAFLAQAVLLGYAAALGETRLYLTMWVLPLATISQFFSRIRRLSEHTGLSQGSSPSEHTRNVINPLETFFLAPHHANYHIEHHLNPAIPFYNLPRYFKSHCHELKTVHSSYLYVIGSLLR